MKKISLLLLVFFLFFSGCNKQEKDNSDTGSGQAASVVQSDTKIKIGFFTVPPHIWMDETGKMRGALYELIANHIAPEIGMDFEWETEPSTIPRQVETLQQKENYIAALLTKSPEREGISIFLETPFFLSQSAIAISMDNPLKKISSLSDVESMTIGYAEKALISPFLNNDSIKFDLVGDPNFLEINFDKLLKNRIDAVYVPDKAGLLATMKKLGLESQVRILDLPESPVGFYTVFSKDLSNLAGRFADAFDKLDGQKLYLELLKKYLDTSLL